MFTEYFNKLCTETLDTFSKPYLYADMDQAYFVNFFSGGVLVSGKPHHSALLVYSRVSQPVGHGLIFDDSRPDIIETEYILQVEPFSVNVGSSCATNDIL